MLRKFLKKQARKPLSRHVNGLFEELEPRVLYSAAPMALPAEAFAGETIHLAPMVTGQPHAGSGTGLGGDAFPGSGIATAEAGYEQIRATLDGIELWPLNLDGDPDALPAAADEGAPETAGDSSALLEFDEAQRYWLQDDDSILQAGFGTRESFSAMLPDAGDADETDADPPVSEEPPVVNLKAGSESFSIYHEQEPREVMGAVDSGAPEVQGAELLAAIPLVQFTTLEV